MQGCIPYTALHVVNLQNLLKDEPNKQDPWQMKELLAMNHPVEIGDWQQGIFHGRGHFYDLDTANTYIQTPHHGEGPRLCRLTGLPYDWEHFDAVQWANPCPPHLDGKPYFYETEAFLASHRLPNSDYYHEYLQNRRAYRQRMAELSWADGGMGWIPEYWQCHAYSANDSQDGIRVPNLARSAVQGRPGQVPVEEMERRQNFRLAMAQKLDAQTLQRPIALEYWKYHPLDTATDTAEVVRAYHENEAKREVRGRRRRSDEYGRDYIDLTGSEPVRKVRSRPDPDRASGRGNIYDGPP